MSDENDDDELDMLWALLRQPGVKLGEMTFKNDIDEDGKPCVRWSIPVEGVKFNPRFVGRMSSE